MRKLAPLLLAACLPLSFSGSNVPTDHTFRLTADDIEAAASDECNLTWVSSDPELNRAKALDLLDARGVKIVEKRATWFLTRFTRAMPNRLYLSKGFSEKPIPIQAEILTHEVFHYCQRDQLGAEFELAYIHSAGRWRLETPAHGQQIRTAVAHGVSPEEISVWITHLVGSMRNSYWLWDIDPVQYETETRRVFELAAAQ